MARLWSSGIELNGFLDFEGTSGSPVSQTVTIRSGTYAMRANNTGGARHASMQFSTTNQTAPFFYRVYIQVAAAPSAQLGIIRVLNSSFSPKISIRINTDMTLGLWNEEDSTQTGSNSSALSLNTWYRIELSVDTTTIASTTVDARIDGVSFASGTENLAQGQAYLNFGQFAADATFNGFFEDIAINDSTGSFQNSWPGIGEIIHLRPNATGDNSAWGGDNTDIDEVTPDDITTRITTSTLNDIEDVNLNATPAAMASDDTINCVAVGVRFNKGTATGANAFVLRIMAASGGTVEESANLAPTTTWSTNQTATPHNYHLTLYDLPGASTTAWTKADLDTTQIGVRESSDSADTIQVSTLWLLVDHQPAAGGGGGATTAGWRSLMGVGN